MVQMLITRILHWPSELTFGPITKQPEACLTQ